MAANAVVPELLRPIAHYVKIGNENASRDPVIQYWCLFYAVQTGMSIDKKSPDALQYLTTLLSTLEAMKKTLADNEAISQEMVAQAHIENFAVKLFDFADKNDRQSNFTKSVIKSFYTAGHLIDVLALFGKLDENLVSMRKYAKWKATYIHNCLKNGEVPNPGPAMDESNELDDFNIDVPKDSSLGTNTSGMPSNIANTSAKLRPTTPPRSQPTADVCNRADSSGSGRIENTPEVSNSSGLTMDDFLEAQKYAKYAVSALSYEDATTAVESMLKALTILQKN